MKINQPAVAGTLESGDVMIRIAPLDTQDIDLQINSSVEKQFGDAIRTTILDVLARYNVRGVQLNVDDKGALDCIIVCTMTASLGRGCIFSALPVAVFQGTITLFAGALSPIMTTAALDSLSLVGSMLIFCVGVNLIRPQTFRTANMLPSVIIAVIYALLF